MKIKPRGFCLSKVQRAVENWHRYGVHRSHAFAAECLRQDSGCFIALFCKMSALVLFCFFFLIIAPNIPSYVSSWNHVCQCISFCFVFFFSFSFGCCLVYVFAVVVIFFFRLVYKVLGPSQHPCSHLPPYFLFIVSLHCLPYLGASSHPAFPSLCLPH